MPVISSIAVSSLHNRISQGDTAELTAYLRVNEQAVTADQIASVTFTVQDPTDTQTVANGTVETDGSGFYRWTATTTLGEYRVQAQFALVSGEKRSVMMNFTVIDPFNPPAPSDVDTVVEQVQLRLEDCFDSIDGGPWLKEKSMAHFDYTKIAAFIPEALMDINLQMPPTTFDLDYFATPVGNPGPNSGNPNLPLLVKGVLVLTIRHLMRSYAEQPIPQNANVPWNDRTRYQQAWNQIYQVEYADYIQAVRLWKRTTLALGQSALLVFNKAGRMWPYAGTQATRGIWRGYY